MRQGTLAALYAAAALILVAPVFVTQDLVLGDYLNHLARIHVLTTIAQSPALQKFYDPHWHLVPYLAMDVPVAALSRLVGLARAGQLFAAVCVLLPLAGTAALRFAVRGRVGVQPLLAGLFCYNLAFALGFLPFLATSGCAMLVLALWIRSETWKAALRLPVFALLATLLFLGHSFSFLIYGLALAGWECGGAWARGVSAWRKTVQALASAGSQAALPVLLSRMTHAETTFGAVQVTRYGTLAERIGALLSPFYFPAPSSVTPVILVTVLALLAAARFVRIGRQEGTTLAFVAAGAVLMPHMLLNIWGTDLRLPLVLVMLATAFAAPRRAVSPFVRHAAIAMVFLLVAWRAAGAAAYFSSLGAQQAQMTQLLEALPRGQRLLVIDAPQDAPLRRAARGFIHQMSLTATITRDAFVPSLFASTAPLFLLPSMQASASQGVPPLDFAQLWQGYETPAPPGGPVPFKDGGAMYWLGWPAKFDYVLITHFGGAVPALPPCLRQVRHNDVATLYRIER